MVALVDFDIDTLGVTQWVHDNRQAPGMWVYGARGSGSTTLSKLIRGMLGDEYDAKRIRAAEISKRIKVQWGRENLLRSHPDDHALWDEWDTEDRRMAALWDAPLLSIDDLYANVNVEFWVKFNIVDDIDTRLKSGKLTLVSGSVPPTIFGSSWGRAFSKQFAVLEVPDGTW